MSFELEQLREAAEKYTYHALVRTGSGRGSYGNGEKNLPHRDSMTL